MTDRELIGIEVNSLLRHIEFDHIDARASLADDIADAVLAAIGDRLLPDLPDTCYILMATQISTGWNVEMIDEHPDNYSGPSYRVVTHDGIGPTISHAIRNALEGES